MKFNRSSLVVTLILIGAQSSFAQVDTPPASTQVDQRTTTCQFSTPQMREIQTQLEQVGIQLWDLGPREDGNSSNEEQRRALGLQLLSLQTQLDQATLAAQPQAVRLAAQELGERYGVSSERQSLGRALDLAQRLIGCAYWNGATLVSWLRNNPYESAQILYTQSQLQWQLGNGMIRLGSELAEKAIETWLELALAENSANLEAAREAIDARTAAIAANAEIAQLQSTLRALRSMSSVVAAELRDHLPQDSILPEPQSRVMHNHFHTLEVLAERLASLVSAIAPSTNASE